MSKPLFFAFQLPFLLRSNLHRLPSRSVENIPSPGCQLHRPHWWKQCLPTKWMGFQAGENGQYNDYSMAIQKVVYVDITRKVKLVGSLTIVSICKISIL